MKPKPPPRLPISPVLNPFLVATLQGRPDYLGQQWLELEHVKPPHVAAYIEWLGRVEPEGAGLSKPTIKQHLAALRMLFDWLVVGHVIESNPAHAVRGPKYSQKKGKTPVLDREEARALIAAIDTSSLTACAIGRSSA
jgi:site-specific recombinase XerD